MRKLATVFAKLLGVVFSAMAQNRTVKGTVKNEKGEPIAFATITEAGTKNATNADESGNFSISIKPNGKVSASATTYNSNTVAAGTGFLTIVVTTAASELAEVVVTTALGVKKQPRELGYSVVRIDNKEIIQATPVNVQNGLTGKVSGLNISTVNNGVFANTRITLRGIRSLTGKTNPYWYWTVLPLH